MKNKLSQKLFTLTLLSILLISVSYTYMMPTTAASEPTASQKSLNILKEVFDLKLDKYNITTNENTPTFPWFGDTQLEDVSYVLTSDESKLAINFFFTNDKLYYLHVFENQGVHELKQAQNNHASAQTFLSAYQKYTSTPLFNELRATLNNIEPNQNHTQTINNKVLEITVYDDNATVRTEFKWYYTANGATAPYTKLVALSFTDGYLSSFADKWDFYPIGSTKVTLSRESAVDMALEVAKHRDYTVPLGEDVFDPARFNSQLSVSWVSLGFAGSLDAANPRSENILVLYPVWQVGIVFNEVFGELYGVEIDIWADTCEVRSEQEAYSALVADWFKARAAEEEQATSSLESGVFSVSVLSVQIVFLGFFMGLSGAVMVMLFKKRQSMGLLQLRRFSAKAFALLFGLLLLLMVFLPLIETASASTAGVIWGSRSTGAPNSPTSYSWRKMDGEINKQASVQSYLSTNCFISANGYAGFPSINTNKGAIISQAKYLSANYDHVSVVDFDHGVIGYPGTVPSSTIPSNEAHYMFEDDYGTVVGSISSNYNDFSHGVFDVDIYDAFPAGKVNFAFINTCYSANVWHLGQGFSSSGYPLSLPFAFTHRLTSYIPSGSTATTMSDDGYARPDAFPQCYIGYPSGSAALDQRIPNNNAGPQWYEWVTFFYHKALNDNVSVNSALNWASGMQWSGKNFGTSYLRTGFNATWPMYKIVNGQVNQTVNPASGCTLAVYGNGNICLRNFVAPHMVTWPSVVNAWKSDVGVPIYFNVYSVDSYGHKIRYIFDWGDGTQTVTGYNTAGVSVSVPHTWSAQGFYNVKVYAQCENGCSSTWSPNYGVVIGNLYWIEIDTVTNQMNNPAVDVWIDGVLIGTTPVCYLVGAGWHTIEVDEEVPIWEFVEMSDGYANGASRPIYSDIQLTAIYYCGGK